MFFRKETKNLRIIVFMIIVCAATSVIFFVPKLVSAVTYVDGNISINTTWTLANSPYVIQEEITVKPNIILNIEPGVIVKLNYGARLVIQGILHADATANQKIFFTSIADDSVGGDTNRDGSATQPAAGDWLHIRFEPNSLGTFTYAVIRYAGAFPRLMTGIHNRGGAVTIFHTELAYNGDNGIVQENGSFIISNSAIHHHLIGIANLYGIMSITNSSIHDNLWFGLWNGSSLPIRAEKNWWGDASGPYHPILNPGGLGNKVSDNIDFIPWLTNNPQEEPQNQPPKISALGQFKSDEITPITEGGVTTENMAVFKTTLSDPDNNQIKLQVELKKFNQPFDGNNLLESNFVPSGSEIKLKKENLSDGTYKWRARAVNDKGSVSDWQEFGEDGNVDFEVKLVPLYTQVESNYPPRLPEDEWAYLPYAHGKEYSCGSKIYQCGCAITSVVMIARYYNVTEIQGADVNPKEINNWLKNEPGGYQKGNVNWLAAAKYTNWRIQYEKTDKTTNNYALLDEYLNKNQPVISKEARGRGGLPHDHFIVIDNKLATTYGVKDPAWYNTKILDEPESNNANKIRDYENGFDGLRIYKKGNGLAQAGMVFSLGSPAELLITDPQGRKVGKDQNSIEYNEIPDAFYFEENYDDPTGEEPLRVDKNKALYILEPLAGEYKLNVIGTGNGSYSLHFSFYDNQGNPLAKEFHSEITSGQIVQYNIFFDPSNINNIHIEVFEEMKSFDIKKMTIFWGFDCPEFEEELEEIKDLEKEMPKLEKKLSKHCFKKKNTFTLWGSFELPKNYQKDGLDESVLFNLKFGDKQTKDKISFKELNNLWLYQEKFHQNDSLGQGINIKTAIIYWSPERESCKKWDRLCLKKVKKENWFYIRGELSLDGVNIDTQPQQVEVSLEIPIVSDEINGSIFGKDVIEFKKAKHFWFYSMPFFRKFWDIFGLFRKIIK